jgi:hypothetical protein
MSTDITPISNARLWTGRVLSYLPAAMLLLDGVMKLFKPQQVIEGTVRFGFPESTIIPMGIALIVSVVCYVIPKTAVVGAALLTGYLGGAVCTHVNGAEVNAAGLQVSDPLWQIFFPAFFGMLLWAGLVLREPRLEILLPWKR